MHAPSCRTRRALTALLALAPLFVSSAVLQGAASSPRAPQRGDTDVATVTVVPGTTSARPGQWVPVAVIIDLQPTWHIHTNDPQVPAALGSADDYIRTAIAAGATADGRLRPDPSRIQWPAPTMAKVSFGGPTVEYGVFERRVIAYLPVEVPADAEPGVATLQLAVTYQACDDSICLAPVEGKPFTAQIAVDPAAVGFPQDQTYPELFTGFDPSVLPASAPADTAAPKNRSGLPVAIIGGLVIFVVGLVLFLKRVL